MKSLQIYVLRQVLVTTVFVAAAMTALITLFGSLRLVDFEYAQLAPPVLDLASVSVMNDFSAGDDDRLLDACHGASSSPFSRQDFAKVRRLVALTAHFWARVHPGHGVDRFLLDGGDVAGGHASA